MTPTRIRTWTLRLVLLVAGAAAVLSFVALFWIGTSLGLHPLLAWLLPVCVDGFAVACSIGVVRSQTAHEPVSARRSEWGGLLYALGLSVAGNVAHAVHYLDGTPLPHWLAIVYTAAPPITLIGGLHLLGRTVWRTDEPVQPVQAPEVVHGPETTVQEPERAQPVDEPVEKPQPEPVHTPPPLHAVGPLPVQPVRAIVRANFLAAHCAGHTWTAAEVGDRCGVSRPQGSRIRTAWLAELSEQEAARAHG